MANEDRCQVCRHRGWSTSLGVLLPLACMFAVMLTVVPVTHASPVQPGVFTLMQPDGTAFEARQWGDERIHGCETAGGFTIILDGASGYWVFAGLGPDGNLVAMTVQGRVLIAGKDSPAGTTKHLRPKPAQPSKAASFRTPMAGINPKPNVGTQKALVLLVAFTDRIPSTSVSYWSNLFFGSSGSVRKYFEEVSYGKLTIAPAEESQGTPNDGVVGIYLPYPHPNAPSSADPAWQGVARDVITIADAYMDFSRYDTDGNGYISSTELHIVVVLAGYEAACTGHGSPSVWAHHGSTQYGVVADGKTLLVSSRDGGYVMMGEMHKYLYHQEYAATAGVPCHELGHDLALPDLYDTDYTTEGVGEWSLMGSGSWCATGSSGYSGDSPSHPDPWSKWYEGWLVPVRVTANSTGLSIPQAESSSTVYQLLDNPNGVDWVMYERSGAGEYFLIENRQKVGFDVGLPGAGLLIWHIDESVIDNNNANRDESRRLVDIEQADGLYQLNRPPAEVGYNSGDTGDPFPGASWNRTFSGTSTPNSGLYSGVQSNVSVYNISNSGSIMTFSVPGPPSVITASLPPAIFTQFFSLTLQASGGAGGYTWTKVSGTLPAGVTLSSSGVLSGTPTGSGTFTFRVRVTDSAGATAEADLTLPVTAFMTASASDADVVVMAWGNTAVSGDNSWTLSVTPLTVKASLTAADMTVSGLPAGLTVTAAKGTGNTIVVTIRGTSITPVARFTPVSIVVKASAVTEGGAVDAAAVTVYIRPVLSQIAAAATDSTVSMALGNRSVSSDNSTWVFNVTAGTVKSTAGAGDLTIGGLPAGLTFQASKGTGNSIVVTLSGTAAQAVDATVSVSVTIKDSAVTEAGATDSSPISVSLVPGPRVFTVSVTDADVVVMAWGNTAVSGDNSWTLSVTPLTVRASLTAADLTVTGLPTGLAVTAAKGTGNTIVLTVSGTAAQAVSAQTTVSVVVKSSAVTESGAFDGTPVTMTLSPAPCQVIAVVTDSTVTMATGGTTVSSTDNSWTLSLTSGTVKSTLSAGDLLVGGLPSGLTLTAAKGTGNTIVITVGGTASPALSASASVGVVIKGSAVTETGASNSAAIIVTVQIAGGAPVRRIPNNTIIFGTKAYDLSLLNDAALVNEILAAFVANWNSFAYKMPAGNFIDPNAQAVDPATLPAISYMDANKVVTDYRAGDGDVIVPLSVYLASTASGIGKIATLTTDGYPTALQYRLLKADGTALTQKVNVGSSVVVMFLNPGDTCKVELYDAAGTLLDTQTVTTQTGSAPASSPVVLTVYDGPVNSDTKPGSCKV